MCAEGLCTVGSQRQNRHQTIYFYDWMVRDFFQFMLKFADGWTRVPGTTDQIQLGNGLSDRPSLGQVRPNKMVGPSSRSSTLKTPLWQMASISQRRTAMEI
jgi:hypothetical protein